MVASTSDNVNSSTASRRASILSLGGATLAAALAAPTRAGARQKKGKGHKERCGKSRSQCRASMTQQCELQGSNSELCIELFVPCCELLTAATYDPFLACLFAD